jgi:hypothetical protein
VPLLHGGLVPVIPVGHGGGERGFSLAIGVIKRLVAVGQLLLASSFLVVTALLGRGGFGADAKPGQPGVPGGGADLAKLIADPLGRPGRLDRVGVAQVQQHPVGHAPHVGPVGWAEGGEGLVPGGPQVRGGRDRFGADRVGGVVVAGQFPPGTDGGGPPLPVQPVQRILGHRAQGGDRPGRGVLSGVLTDAVPAGVHQHGDLSDVSAALGVGDLGDL